MSKPCAELYPKILRHPSEPMELSSVWRHRGGTGRRASAKCTREPYEESQHGQNKCASDKTFLVKSRSLQGYSRDSGQVG